MKISLSIKYRCISAWLLTGLCTATQAGNTLPLKLWYNKPARFFEESLPIGNGKLGALVYGGTKDDVLYLNDITLWTGKPVDRNLDQGAYKHLPAIRQALFDENYALADSLQLHLQGPNSQYYQPLATLHIEDLDGGTATCYHRELDIDSALCRDRYTRGGANISREYFASAPDGIIAIRIAADKPGAIRCRLVLTAQVPHKARAAEEQITLTGHAIGKEEESTHFCTMLRAVNKDGTITAQDSTLTIEGATEAVVYILNETSFNGFDKHPVKEGAPYIETANDRMLQTMNHSYDDFRARHVADYRRLFARFSLNLGGATFDKTRPTDQQLKDYTDQGGHNTYLEQLYTQYGRYLLISASRTPGVPANLQGLWAPAKFSPWRGNYTVNINLEENYWPAETANLAEMVIPLNGFVKALSQNGQYTARNYYGIGKGWCSSHNSDIWAMTNPVGEKREKPEWANWNMGGAWLVETLWEHYLFGRDKNYLKNTAYPLMKGAAEFMLEWLVDNPKAPGELITAPSTSPENEYITDKGYHGMTCYGGTADLAILRELFANTINAARTLNVDKPLRTRMAQALERLHPYKVGKRGNLQEWYYDWDDYDWHHRHQSHLIGLYPGHHITVATTPLLAQACTRSLEIKGDQSTGWSTGWRINLWARLKNAPQAYHIFQKLLTYVSPDGYEGADKRVSGGTYPNLFDAHPPFQIDGNFGGTAGVIEMLVQSTPNTIELLPALPATWQEGSVNGIRARGGFTVDMTWAGGRVKKAVISSSKGGKTTVAYNGTTRTVKVKAGGKVVIEE